MATTTLVLPPPPFQSPLLTGVPSQITQPWLQFFEGVFRAAGGNSGGGGGGGGTTSGNDFLGFGFSNVDDTGLQSQIDGLYSLTSSSYGSAFGDERSIQFNVGGDFSSSSNLLFLENDSLMLSGVRFQVVDSELQIAGKDAIGADIPDSVLISAGMTNATPWFTLGGSLALQRGSLTSGGNVSLTAGNSTSSDFEPAASFGGLISIVAGSSDTGGSVSITSGNSVSTPGADVIITTGTSGRERPTEVPSSGSGKFIVNIGLEPALTVNSDKAFGVGAAVNYGEPGQVLSSTGSSSEPEWTNTGVVEVVFQYGDIDTIPISTLASGKIVLSVSIVITEAFDDPSAQLSIGITGDTSVLMETTDNLPGEPGTYGAKPGIKFVGVQTINLYKTAGASTQGSGLVTIVYQI